MKWREWECGGRISSGRKIDFSCSVGRKLDFSCLFKKRVTSLSFLMQQVSITIKNRVRALNTPTCWKM